MVKRIAKILLYTVLGLIGLLVLVAVGTQTSFFRDKLRTEVLTRLDSVLVADTHLGEISGNLVTGFSVDGLSLKVQGDTLLVVDRLDLRYDLLGALSKRIAIENITLVRPRITLLRGKDGVWNFGRMVRPTPEDTTTAGAFDWLVNAGELRIENGSLRLVDSSTIADPLHEYGMGERVEYHDFLVKNFNIVISATFSSAHKQAHIRSLSFLCDRPDFRLDELSGVFRFAPDSTSITDLKIRTDKSSVELDAFVGVDASAGISAEQLQQGDIRLNLKARDIDMRELAAFIPDIEFLRGRAAIDVDASGTLEELSVNSLRVVSGQSHMFVSGELINVIEPSLFQLNVHLTESDVSPDDVHRMMPSIGIERFRAIGTARLNIHFVGKPSDFETTVSLNSPGGNIQAKLALKTAEQLVYDGTASVTRLDLAKILGDSGFASGLNGNCSIKGRGTSLESMNTAAIVQIDSSRFLDQVTGPSEVSVSVVDGNVAASVSGSLGETNVELQGGANTKTETFSLVGGIRRLDLRDILRDPLYSSDLTMDVNLDGRGFSWGKLNGQFNLDLTSSSRYREYLIEHGDVRVFLNQQDPALKEFSVESDIADFSLRGAFRMDHLIDLILYEVQNIRLALGENLVVLDSSLASTVDRAKLREFGKLLRQDTSSFDATYELRLKNLDLLSFIAGEESFDGEGVLRGAIIGNFEALSVDGRLNVKSFLYGTAESGMLLEDAEASFVITNLLPENPLRDLEFRIAAEALRMHINRTELDDVDITFTLGRDYSRYSLSTRQADWRVALRGIAHMAPNRVVATLNGFDVGYKSLQWSAEGGATVGFSPEEISVENLVLHRGDEQVSISGGLNAADLIGGQIGTRNMDLTLLDEVLGTVKEERPMFSGRADLDITVEGTTASPRCSARILASDVMFKKVPFGMVRGNFLYGDAGLNTEVFVDAPFLRDSLRSALSIVGMIPISLTPSQNSVEKEFDVTIRSTGVEIGILDPLLPTFDRLQGELTCDTRVTGTMQEPRLSGSFRLDSCRFLFVPNNIAYEFEGQFKPEGEQIRVVSAVVRNLRDDRKSQRPGRVEITGDFSLRNLKPTDFNLTAKGALLLVKETTRRSSLSVYGNLFVETDGDGLHFTGTQESSLLRGGIVIQNSSIVFPPVNSATSVEAARAVRVILWDDTSKTAPVDSTTVQTRYFGALSGTGLEEVDTPYEPPRKSFLDGVRYDLEIESRGGNTQLRMIFNATTGEELVANLEGKISVLEDGKTWLGTMTIDRAYYYFTKRFNAYGTIGYSGDYLDPEMSITATYEGTRVLVDSSGGDTREEVVITLKISGTRKEPELDISMTIDGTDYYSYSGPKSSDVNSDAIQFLITGNFPLTESQKNDIAAELGTTVGTSLVSGATSLLSNTLSEFLRNETGFINSVEIGVASGGGTDIRLSGVAFSGLWRYGGKILDDPLSNANISILYSFGDIFSRQSLRNFMFELERKAATGVNHSTDREDVYSARLFYRFSF